MTIKDLARNILANVGGKENISDISYCATRLRMNLKDNSMA